MPWFRVDVPLIHRAGVNGSVLAFAVMIAIVTACLTGVVPAWMSSAGVSAATLNVRGQSAGPRHLRAIGLLVTSQVALTVVLLVSTGLLLKSAAHLLAVEAGFNSSNVLTMTISLPNNQPRPWFGRAIRRRRRPHSLDTSAYGPRPASGLRKSISVHGDQFIERTTGDENLS